MKVKRDSLAKLSKGKNGIVCKYANKFINFDELKKELHYQKMPKTPDMLYINKSKKEIWFVEFKSNEKENLKNLKYNVKRKILDGIIVFYELFGEKFCGFSKNYLIVYKDFVDIECEIINYFGYELEEIYDLKELEGNFLQYSAVMNCLEFKSFFKKCFGIEFKEME